MIYACDACRYLFASEKENMQDCPDCGKHQVRLGTQEEIEEYKKQRKEAETWYNEGGYIGKTGV